MLGELFNLFCIEFIAMDHCFKYLGGLALRRASPQLITFISICWMVFEYCMIRKAALLLPGQQGNGWVNHQWA